jgi:predicted short-subunit dehydrogenase-like oxidoreductase (DUF2520 family)
MKLSFIGAGNVAYHLAQALFDLDYEVLSVVSRTGTSAEILANNVRGEWTTNIRDINPNTDLIFICAPDDEIPGISAEIRNSNATVVHTSGTVSIDALENHRNRGVFYPLQSFSIGTDVNFWNIPVLLESSNTNVEIGLDELAYKVSSKVRYLNSEQRKAVHLAAVFANNFSNHMLTMAKDICNKYEADFELLHPLISKTMEKALGISPENAQTGPAVRNDQKTIEKHRELLRSDEKTLEIYDLITRSIIEKYNK